MTWQSGGGGPASLSGKELAYAERSTNFTVPNTAGGTVVGIGPLAPTVPNSIKYCLEFFCYELNEDSGSTAGDTVILRIVMDGVTTIQRLDVVQGDGGIGSAAFMKTKTLVGDGASHTFDVVVLNDTADANGAIVAASAFSPMYFRAVGL